MIKNFSQVGRVGTYLNKIKANYEKPTTSIILNGQNLQVFLLRLGTKQGCSFSTTHIQDSTGNPSHSNQTRRRNKSIQIGKELVKLFLFADDKLLYKENPKDIAKKLPELLNKFSRLTIYKINMYKSVVFLYANSKLTKREMKSNLIRTCFKINKIPRNKPNQGCKRPVLRKL